MKAIIYTLSFLAIISSCQKVIDIDLNEANPKFVLEANYTAEDSTVVVLISKTANYFGSDSPAKINTATVTITDHTGAITTVPFIADGRYELANYIPIFGTTYTLDISAEGQDFTAQCEMHSPVSLNDITYEYSPGFFGSGDGYFTYLNFLDPVNVTNHYIVVITENGEVLDKPDQFILQDDALTDGNLVERPLFTGELFELGDEIELEFRSIDEDIYKYYNELISIVGGGQASAAPANPKSNWDNGGLGYFSAYSNNRKSVIIL